MDSYQSRYSWHHPLNDYVVAHTDGQVSCYLSYTGVDPCLKTSEELDAALSPLRSLLDNLPYEMTCEFHLWRGKCRDTLDQYLANSERTVRGHDFANHGRHLIAEKLFTRSASNKVGIVLSLGPTFWQQLRCLCSQKRKLRTQVQIGNTLLERLQHIEGTLQDLKLETLDVYGQAVWRSYHRAYFEDGLTLERKVKPSHPLNVQWAGVKPDFIEQENIMKVGGVYCWSGLLKQTPDAVDPHWFYALNRTLRGNVEGFSEIDVHISHVLQKSSASFAANRSERAAQKTQEAHTVAGGSENRGKASDELEFAYEVADRNLKVFRHVYQIQLYSQDYEFLKQRVKDLKKWFASEYQNAELLNNRYIAESVWRNAMPGMGYLNRFWLQHTHLYVSCMIPSVQFDRGSAEAISLQLTQDGELIGLDYPHDESSHALISGKTGVGKGVRKSIEVMEFGSVGWDWYILEVGQTHRWTVECLGGTYISLDPDKHVINPFPSYANVAQMSQALKQEKGVTEEGEWLIPKGLVTGTVNGISFTFLGPGGFENLPKSEIVHYQMVAEAAMVQLYTLAKRRQNVEAPNLNDFYQMMKQIAEHGELNGPQSKAARAMLDHMKSYLATEVGQIFQQDNNLSIESGIIGIDFDPIKENEALYRAFLTFVCMRFGQLAFSSSAPSRVLLEEVHNTKGVDPKAVTNLARNVALMGRKASAAIELSGQDIGQFRFADAAGSSDTESQIDYLQLFYTEKSHHEVAATYRLPAPVVETWESFSNPKSHRKSYRDMLLGMNGRWYEILGVQPEFFLWFLSTNNKATLEQKALISQRLRPELFRERVQALREWQEAHLTNTRQDANDYKPISAIPV